MSRGAQIRQEQLALVGLDTPLRLEQAVKVAFPFGGMTVSGLRKERDRGNLCIEKIAGKEFTTLRNIEEMRVKCRAQHKVQDYGSSRKSVTNKEGSPGVPRGSLEMGRIKSARDALDMTARALNVRSPNTSLRNIPSRDNVGAIPQKS
jgi:hypothetical protein